MNVNTMKELLPELNVNGTIDITAPAVGLVISE
jgi:hypothetical protein